jgi:electron transfer flavoprotein alpha subunit
VANVLLIAEHREGKIQGPTLETIVAGRALAGADGAVTAALFGDGVEPLAEDLAGYGVDVLHVEDPELAHYTVGAYVQAAKAAADAAEPRAVLLPHSATGFDLAPRLAADLRAPIVTNCSHLALEDGTLVVRRSILNGKVEAEMALASDRPYVATVRLATFRPAEKASVAGTVRPLSVALDPAKMATRFREIRKPEVKDIDIAQADIVVSAGRGIQKQENLALVEDLAKTLGGVVGASRPLTDMEWLPKTRQVGQSGKTVRPKLYVACGISGAMQHVSGMKDSSLILAINTDPSAPIFEVAHYGVVADVLQFLPALMKELRGK